MKKIFESGFNGGFESAQNLYVYEFENEKEYWKFDEMNFEEKCNYFGVREEYPVMPGGSFHRYIFNHSANYVVVYETIAYNV